MLPPHSISSALPVPVPIGIHHFVSALERDETCESWMIEALVEESIAIVSILGGSSPRPSRWAHIPTDDHIHDLLCKLNEYGIRYRLSGSLARDVSSVHRTRHVDVDIDIDIDEVNVSRMVNFISDLHHETGCSTDTAKMMNCLLADGSVMASGIYVIDIHPAKTAGNFLNA